MKQPLHKKHPKLHKKEYAYTWNEFDSDIKKIINHLTKNHWQIDRIYAIPKGGLVLGVTLANILKTDLIPTLPTDVSKEYLEHTLIVDDISDSGQTLLTLHPKLRYTKIITLFTKPHTKLIPDFHCREINNEVWAIFPWENEHTPTKTNKTTPKNKKKKKNKPR